MPFEPGDRTPHVIVGDHVACPLGGGLFREDLGLHGVDHLRSDHIQRVNGEPRVPDGEILTELLPLFWDQVVGPVAEDRIWNIDDHLTMDDRQEIRVIPGPNFALVRGGHALLK